MTAAVSLALVLATMGLPAPSAPVVAVFPSGAEFTLEVSVTPAERALGYMFRDHVGPREGMLFVFPETGLQTFWMKNCRVSLDIIWLDEQWKVVDIASERPPCPEKGRCPTLTPMFPARYVLEVAGGRARQERLSRGDRVVVLGWETR